MSNQQIPFSVRVSKGDFLIKALKAYTHYSKLAKQYSTEYSKCTDEGKLNFNYLDFSSKASDCSKRVTNIISMVSMSSDEFVNVTEDIYKLIYRYQS